jgi:predicted amidohydrolase
LAGNDARNPEVGRIMALQGADLRLHCGALEGNQTCWLQTAAMWAQVQQNQVFAVEAQLSTTVAVSSFGAALAVADLDLEALQELRRNHPWRDHNPELYSNDFPKVYYRS